MRRPDAFTATSKTKAKSRRSIPPNTKWSRIGRSRPGEEPSGIAFDAAHHRLFSTCHNKMMMMLDTETGKVVATVPIGAGVGWLRVR